MFTVTTVVHEALTLHESIAVQIIVYEPAVSGVKQISDPVRAPKLAEEFMRFPSTSLALNGPTQICSGVQRVIVVSLAQEICGAVFNETVTVVVQVALAPHESVIVQIRL